MADEANRDGEQKVNHWCWGPKGFFAHLITVLPRTDWPDFLEMRGFWDNWQDTFTRNGTIEAEAREAVGMLASQRIGFVADYLPALIERIAQVHETRGRNDPGQGSFLQAKSESWNCPECGGEGWASREFRMPSHTDVPLRGALVCRCPAGRAVKRAIDGLRNTAKDGNELYRQVDDLQSHPKLWTCNHPSFVKQPLPSPLGKDDGYWLEVQ